MCKKVPLYAKTSAIYCFECGVYGTGSPGRDVVSKGTTVGFVSVMRVKKRRIH